jgi:hypothetical protein
VTGRRNYTDVSRELLAEEFQAMQQVNAEFASGPVIYGDG